eukprot:3228606-Ditylum_brightwellii.AAC.1
MNRSTPTFIKTLGGSGHVELAPNKKHKTMRASYVLTYVDSSINIALLGVGLTWFGLLTGKLDRNKEYEDPAHHR